jgi:hypothetical protein
VKNEKEEISCEKMKREEKKEKKRANGNLN